MSASSQQLMDRLNRKLGPYMDAAEALLTENGRVDGDFPSIVVIGDQSDGKSTVLQAISRLKFPRNEGLSTRCPIQLSLRRGLSRLEISFVIGGRRELVTATLDNFEAKIREAQERLVQSNGSEISSDVIHVTMQSPDGFDLTLIDLPGIARNTTAIENQTVQIIESFIQNPHTIIIVVFKSTADVVTLKGFQLARQVDPAGERTIGVITHCDAMCDNWENQINELVSGRRPEIGAKRFIPVACVKYIEDGAEAELDILLRRPVFQAMDPNLLGTQQLVKTLGREISTKLAPWFDTIKGLVTRECGRYLAMLKEELNGQPTEVHDARQTTIEHLSRLGSRLHQHLTGTSSYDNHVFYSHSSQRWNTYAKEIRDKTDEIKKNAAGLIAEEFKDQHGSGPEILFNALPPVKRIVKRVVTEDYSKVTERACDDVNKMVDDLLKRLVEDQVDRRKPKMKEYLLSKVKSRADHFKKDARSKVQDVLDMESVCIDSRNRTYADRLAAIERELLATWHSELATWHSAPETPPPPCTIVIPPDASELLKGNLFATKVYLVLVEYLNMLSERIIDEVPYTMHYFLNYKLAEDTHQIICLVSDLTEQKLLEMSQDPDSAKRLHEIRTHLNLWQTHENALNGVNEAN